MLWRLAHEIHVYDISQLVITRHFFLKKFSRKLACLWLNLNKLLATWIGKVLS